MAYYALLDDNNVVTQVIVGQENPVTYWQDFYSGLFGQRCLLTDFNTRAGINENGGTPFRGNYAGVGFTYDEELDAFIAPKPEPTKEVSDWVLNEDTFSWEPVEEAS